MLTLALDTTSRRGSLALAREAELLEAVQVEAPNGFGQIIYQEIQALLARRHVALPDVDCYAAAAGPGSFTGIRVGLTAAKALAEVHGKMVVPVSNLLALAAAGQGSYRAPVMDARRGEVYAAVYDEQLRVVLPEVAMPWLDFLQLVGDRRLTFVSTDPCLFRPSGVAPLELDAHPNWRYVAVSPLLAGAVARVAATSGRERSIPSPEAADANYVRRPDAELNWKDPS